MTTPLVSFNHLSVSFAGERTRVRAVQEVSFTIQAGQTVGVVGESGCGKSVTAMALMGLLPPQAARIDGGCTLFPARCRIWPLCRRAAPLPGAASGRRRAVGRRFRRCSVSASGPPAFTANLRRRQHERTLCY